MGVVGRLRFRSLPPSDGQSLLREMRAGQVVREVGRREDHMVASDGQHGRGQALLAGTTGFSSQMTLDQSRGTGVHPDYFPQISG